jgi:hypothetical protein
MSDGDGEHDAGSDVSGVPAFVMDDVRLLFSQLTTPESQVRFDPPDRANPQSIEDTIRPPQATWDWADQAARLAQHVVVTDLGKYGLQRDTSMLYRLVSLSPVRWARCGTSARRRGPGRTSPPGTRNRSPRADGETGIRTVGCADGPTPGRDTREGPLEAVRQGHEA